MRRRGGLFVLCFIVFLIACVVGWGMNVYKFTKLDFESPYKAEIVRGFGILPVFPMGAIIGYFNIDDIHSVKEIRIVK